ncbi:hypothetical protein [Tsuneonella amylolytica]|uniref:hypothetical protein n=1 Tax=Tsuneonella amylolytica TaxID=2338327 RepID=UPI0013C4851A|nr:hypothetical protein [Tsuneonella amylolytica]
MRAALVLAIVPALGGCKALGMGSHSITSTASLTERLSDDFGTQQLELGRAALAKGHTVEAIEAFMLAKLYPEQAAAAYNGLAVAYSRTGRTDLTERFFQTAVMLAPNEDRYRGNLALFYSSNPVVRANETALAVASFSQPVHVEAPAPVAVALVEIDEPKVQALGGGVTVQTGGSRVRRISDREVAIRGGASAAPKGDTIIRRQAVIEVGGGRPNSVIRFGLVDGAIAKKTQYPIRIDLNAGSRN